MTLFIKDNTITHHNEDPPPPPPHTHTHSHTQDRWVANSLWLSLGIIQTRFIWYILKTIWSLCDVTCWWCFTWNISYHDICIETGHNALHITVLLQTTRHCQACRTYEIPTRFLVVVICPIIKCLTVLEFSFYFVWFVFLHHNLQFYFELCTYCNILDTYLL